MKTVLRWVLTGFMVMVGVRHFTDPEPFVRIVPPFFPGPLALVYVSGFFEILGGLGLAWSKTRRWAAWGLIALFVAVFPANVHMAIHQLPFGDTAVSPTMLWLRLPLQGLLILWAWWYTRPASEFSS